MPLSHRWALLAGQRYGIIGSTLGKRAFMSFPPAVCVASSSSVKSNRQWEFPGPCLLLIFLSYNQSVWRVQQCGFTIYFWQATKRNGNSVCWSEGLWGLLDKELTILFLDLRFPCHKSPFSQPPSQTAELNSFLPSVQPALHPTLFLVNSPMHTTSILSYQLEDFQAIFSAFQT